MLFKKLKAIFGGITKTNEEEVVKTPESTEEERRVLYEETMEYNPETEDENDEDEDDDYEEDEEETIEESISDITVNNIISSIVNSDKKDITRYCFSLDCFDNSLNVYHKVRSILSEKSYIFTVDLLTFGRIELLYVIIYSSHDNIINDTVLDFYIEYLCSDDEIKEYAERTINKLQNSFSEEKVINKIETLNMEKNEKPYESEAVKKFNARLEKTKNYQENRSSTRVTNSNNISINNEGFINSNNGLTAEEIILLNDVLRDEDCHNFE